MQFIRQAGARGATVAMAFGRLCLDLIGTEASFRKCWNSIITQMRFLEKHTFKTNICIQALFLS